VLKFGWMRWAAYSNTNRESRFQNADRGSYVARLAPTGRNQHFIGLNKWTYLSTIRRAIRPTLMTHVNVSYIVVVLDVLLHLLLCRHLRKHRGFMNKCYA
jgi:hypothetical protein